MWREQLKMHLRLDARGADQYGTLLACGDVALGVFDNDSEDTAEITERIGALLVEARADDVPDWRRCADHLMTFAGEFWRGGDKMTIGRMVAQAGGRFGLDGADQAQRALATYGLRVVTEDGAVWVAVANQHSGLSGVYRGTVWGQRSVTGGGWRQTLLRTPGSRARTVPLRFEGHASRVVLVPLEAMLGDA